MGLDNTGLRVMCLISRNFGDLTSDLSSFALAVACPFVNLLIRVTLNELGRDGKYIWVIYGPVLARGSLVRLCSLYGLAMHPVST